MLKSLVNKKRKDHDLSFRSIEEYEEWLKLPDSSTKRSLSDAEIKTELEAFAKQRQHFAENVLPHCITPSEYSLVKGLPDAELAVIYSRYFEDGRHAILWDSILWKIKSILDQQKSQPRNLKTLQNEVPIIKDFYQVYSKFVDDGEVYPNVYHDVKDTGRVGEFWPDVDSYLFNPKNPVSAVKDHKVFRKLNYQEEDALYFGDILEVFSKLILLWDLYENNTEEYPALKEHLDFLKRHDLLSGVRS